MDEYDDLDAYNDNVEHDMWVDFDYHENTGELSDLFESTGEQTYFYEETDEMSDIFRRTGLDEFIDDIDDPE